MRKPIARGAGWSRQPAFYHTCRDEKQDFLSVLDARAK